MTLFLVRHGRPRVDPDRPAAEWELDPAGYDDVWALRESHLLPVGGSWFCSPEPKAVATAQLLTEREVGVLADLREHQRGSVWLDDFPGALRRALARPDEAAVSGWEPLGACRDRVVPAVRRILDVHAGQDVVLVGHGTAWMLVVAALRDEEPDVEAWEALGMPDVLSWAPGPS